MWIIGGKTRYGMPLRQATLLRRFGGDISSNTLATSGCRWAWPRGPSRVERAPHRPGISVQSRVGRRSTQPLP
ncbi:hypothetical protein CFB46_32375 [Burkholderia sp. HI2761]|nr:hypothetical protein [Burkholderia sp. BE24]OXJ21585.1 hypothetical protein CFB46_32375 [Burkholderia sp. HI2761]